MTEVISVRFKNRGKSYFFSPGTEQIEAGTRVVVETSKGLELADCSQGNHMVEDESVVQPLRSVIRAATPDDLRVAELCKQREKEAFSICTERIAKHGLDMKLVDVECNFEGSKILFFFTSDGRVDFRELVKDLAGIFRTRIELRQIGVRDEAKMIGGLGICGRPFCCSQFMEDFQPVSTKMAKIQNLSLNPTKISGTCGRLMCCLRYEQEAYEALVKTVPKNGSFVETEQGYGSVSQVNLLRRQVKVKLDGSDEAPATYEADDVAVVPGGRPHSGEELPHVWQPRVKEPEPEEEPETAGWDNPGIYSGWEDAVPVQSAPAPQSAAVSAQPAEAVSASDVPDAERQNRAHRSRRGRNGGAPRTERSGSREPAAHAQQNTEDGAHPDENAQQHRSRNGRNRNGAPHRQEQNADAADRGQQRAPGSRNRNRPGRNGGRGNGADGAQAREGAPAAGTRPDAPGAGAGETAGSGTPQGEKNRNYHRRYYHKNKGHGGQGTPGSGGAE